MHPRRHWRLLGAAAGAAVAALLVAACSGSTGGLGSGKPSGAIQKGGTATFALPPGAVPDWIFPFIDSAHSSIDNRNQFEYLMYRPLYWPTTGASPTVDFSRSLASPPVFTNSNKTITIKLNKGYKWSDGKDVTANDVLFTIAMSKAAVKENPANLSAQDLLKEKITEILDSLSEREREIICLRYGIGDGYTYTLEEVGRIFKVTRERVRQIEAKAVRKLQHPVRSRQLEGFLESTG